MECKAQMNLTLAVLKMVLVVYRLTTHEIKPEWFINKTELPSPSLI